MSIASKALEQITAEDLGQLAGTTPDRQRVATLVRWSKAEGAVAAASLANTSGGLVIVGAKAGPDGRVTSVDGAAVSEADLLSAADDLGPAGSYLVRARLVDVGASRVGLLAVAESSAPPVLVETTGAVYCRSADGLAQTHTRQELDQILGKAQLLHERAERNVEGMIDRLAFGHFNYMTLAVVLASRVTTDRPYLWASEHQSALLGLPFATEWGLGLADLQVRPGEVELALSGDVTGFIRVARNGCVAVGERRQRPAQDLFLPAAALRTRIGEMLDAATAPFASSRCGLVAGALFMEGARDLRLPVEGGTTAPATKDLVREFLPERYLESTDERAAFDQDFLRSVGGVFGADLVRGVGVAHDGAAAAKRPEPRNWHGQTKRTERRIAGLRGHGSAR